MSIVPASNIGRITFYESHIINWTSHPTMVGLVSSDCVSLQALITTARKAYDAQQNALTAAKSATQTMKNAVTAMHALGSIDIMKIKTFAEASNNPNVYPLADLPAPQPATPIGPPGTPTDFVVTLLQSGAVMLRWKCVNPNGSVGTLYEIRRKTGTGAFTRLSTEGTREFTDESLPAGAVGVTYEITARRSTVRGLPAQFNVNFGIGSGGGMFIASTSEGVTRGTVGGEMKMAA